MAKKKLIDAVYVNQFGICPVCGGKMLLLKSDYKAYTLSSSGWITSMLDSKTEWEVVCPECNHHHAMTITEYGLTPKELAPVAECRMPVLKDNPIGKKIVDD